MAMNGQSLSGLAGFARLPLCMTSRGLCASHTPPGAVKTAPYKPAVNDIP